MNLYLRKDGRFESRIPNGKRSDGKRSFCTFLHISGDIIVMSLVIEQSIECDFLHRHQLSFF